MTYRNCPKCAAVMDGKRECPQCGYKLRGPKPKILQPAITPVPVPSVLAVKITINVDLNNPPEYEAFKKFLKELST